MRRIALIMAWLAVFLTAVFLRVDDLTRRPMHADEATGARITAMRMESAGGNFNPKHHHGPLLADLTIPVCRMRGEGGWQQMSKESLRMVTVIAGCLTVLVPLLLRRRFGDAPALLAAALLATSPLLVYFSRMFIHESLLALFGMLVVAVVLRWPRWGLPGLMLGLMYAAKETFVISVLAWGGALVLLALENRKAIDRAWLRDMVVRWWRPMWITGAVALVVSLVSYTHGFTHWRGAVDAVRTYFVYETVVGHDKPITYYLSLLCWPSQAGGVWWYGTPVVLLAILGYARSFCSDVSVERRCLIRFLAYAAVGHVVIYSLIAYKTPWLMCLPWAHVCWLAGFGVMGGSRSRTLAWVAAVVAVAALVTQVHQSRLATGRLESDARSPYAYVPTRQDIEGLAEWLGELRELQSGSERGVVAVVGSDYWPLPWYLREFERIGYWPEPTPEVEALPIILAMPEAVARLSASTRDSHEFLPRGLRDEVPVVLFLRKDLWKAWMER